MAGSVDRIKTRGHGCWGRDLAADDDAHLAQLGARCSAGYRTLLPLRDVGPSAPLDASVPENSCVRFFVVGRSVRASLERGDGTVATTSAGPSDAVLPEQGPYCSAKGERLRLRTAGEARALVLISP